MSLGEKNKEIYGKNPIKFAKTAISAIFPAFLAGKKMFLKIRLDYILSIVNMHFCAKNQKELMIKSRENAKKAFFRDISGIFGRKNILFDNRAPSHFEHYHFASVYKIS